MNKIQLTIVKEQKFPDPIIVEIDSLLDKSFRDSHRKKFSKI